MKKKTVKKTVKKSERLDVKLGGVVSFCMTMEEFKKQLQSDNVKTYSSFVEFTSEMKNHKCKQKEYIRFDNPALRLMGAQCLGCGDAFFIGLSALKDSYKSGTMSPADCEKMKTPEGRDQLYKKCEI